MKRYTSRLGSFVSYRKNKIAIYTAVALIIGQCIVLLLKVQTLPLQVPLFYSLPWGEQQLTKASMLWILPLSSFLCFMLNIHLGMLFWAKERLLSIILAWSNVLITVIASLALIKIILLIA